MAVGAVPLISDVVVKRNGVVQATNGIGWDDAHTFTINVTNPVTAGTWLVSYTQPVNPFLRIKEQMSGAELASFVDNLATFV